MDIARSPFARFLAAAVLGSLVASLIFVTPAPAVERPTPEYCLSLLDVTDLGETEAYYMAIDPVDGKVYVGMDDDSHTVRVLDPVTNDSIDTIPVPTTFTVDGVAVDHAADLLYVSSFNADSVYAIDLSTELLVDTLTVPDPEGIAINFESNRLYVAGQASTVAVFNATSHAPLGFLNVGGSSHNVVVDPIHNRVFAPDFDHGTIDVFNGATNGLIDDHDLPGPTSNQPIDLQYDPVADKVWVTTRAPGRVEEVDPLTGAIGVSFSFAGAQGVAINPSIGQGYVAAQSGTALRAFRLSDGSTIADFGVGLTPLHVASSVGPVRIYASGFDDGTVTVLGTGEGPFPDVTGANPFCQDINYLLDEGITTGFDDDTYRPVAPVTRQAMAAFIYRTKGSPPFTAPAVATFPDVPTSHPFFKEIEWMVAEDITGGFPDGTFRPGDQITRQAMAAFLFRVANGSADPTCVAAAFPDVPASSPFCGVIKWMADNGVTGGFGDGTFRPGTSVTRQSMAAFLHRFDTLG